LSSVSVFAGILVLAIGFVCCLLYAADWCVEQAALNWKVLFPSVPRLFDQGLAGAMPSKWISSCLM
jgi:hypothetical protein